MPEDRQDDRLLRDLIAGGLVFPTLLVAHERGLFDLLGDGGRTVVEIGRELDLPDRSVTAMLSVVVAAELVAVDDGVYKLRPIARSLLLAASPTNLCAYLDLLIAASDRHSYAGVRHALLSGEPAGDAMTGEQRTEALTAAMHARGGIAARAWIDQIDLSEHRQMLDIGGGSGVHSMHAVRRWPRLRSCVLDHPAVCAIAAALIAQEGLSDRVETRAGDYLQDGVFPDADVHLCSEVLHNVSPSQARSLVGRSRERLPAGGRIVVHEMLLADDGSGPLGVAAANVNMAVWTRNGRQATRRETTVLLTDAGFVDVDARPTGCGYFWLVSGRAP